MTWLKENLEKNWVGFLFGIFIISCSIIIIIARGFLTEILSIAVAVALVAGILTVVGSLFRPRNDVDNSKTKEESAPSGVPEPEDLAAQYKETHDNQRFLLRLLWEIPTFAITISSAFLVAAYNFFPDNSTSVNLTNDALIRFVLLSFGSLLMFVSFLAVVKHRYYRGVWLDAIKEIEKNMHLDAVPMYTREPEKTESYKRTTAFHKIFILQSVETWLANVLFLVSLVFALLSAFNLYQYLKL